MLFRSLIEVAPSGLRAIRRKLVEHTRPPTFVRIADYLLGTRKRYATTKRLVDLGIDLLANAEVDMVLRYLSDVQWLQVDRSSFSTRPEVSAMSVCEARL